MPKFSTYQIGHPAYKDGANVLSAVMGFNAARAELKRRGMSASTAQRMMLSARAGSHAVGETLKREAIEVVRIARGEYVRRYRRMSLHCADCGQPGERTGHMGCMFPQDH